MIGTRIVPSERGSSLDKNEGDFYVCKVQRARVTIKTMKGARWTYVPENNQWNLTTLDGTLVLAKVNLLVPFLWKGTVAHPERLHTTQLYSSSFDALTSKIERMVETEFHLS